MAAAVALEILEHSVTSTTFAEFGMIPLIFPTGQTPQFYLWCLAPSMIPSVMTASFLCSTLPKVVVVLPLASRGCMVPPKKPMGWVNDFPKKVYVPDGKYRTVWLLGSNGMERLMKLVTCCVILALSLCAPRTARCQTPTQLNGFNSRLPLIPIREPRPAEGSGTGESWQLAPGTPVAGFIDSLTPNDAAIQVVAEQSRLIKLKQPIALEGGTALVAVGDPTILDFDILPNPRIIRLLGLRAGVTDLTITTSDNDVYSFEVHVGWDLDFLAARLRQVFPNAQLRLAQMREHLIVEGQARDGAEVTRILQMIEAYLRSVQPGKKGGNPASGATEADGFRAEDSDRPEVAAAEEVLRGDTEVEFAKGQVINLIRVPGVQQVMLQVRVAELNRTAAREIGADILYSDERGTSLGTQIGGASFITDEMDFIQGLALGNASTAFGVFPSADFQLILRALRRNSVLNVLAEPNLMAVSGETASFLAGGQFPVPVPQGAVFNSVTIQFKDFGVKLDFTPYVLDDRRIRLKVAPEVSSIDASLGTTIVPGGDPVPGISTRRAETTVDLHQGHTLAIAGLLQVNLDARTNRIPGLGDLPYLGPMFSNTSHERVEKELLVLVTPYFVAPMGPDEVMPLPGEEVEDPNDHEFYLLNRIEGRTGRGFRSTTAWDDPWGLVERMKLERGNISGPVGHSKY